MNRTVKIAPSILSADFTRLGEEVRAACQAGADHIHVDVMDGRFVPNITIGPLAVKAVARTIKADFPDVAIDTHLMIVEPEKYIDAFVEAGSDIVGVHVETCPHLHRTCGQIRSAGAKVCVVANPATPNILIEPVLDLVDQVMLMSVNPGWGGQSFIESVLGKIVDLRGTILQRGLEVDIEVDGGINPENIGRIYEAGANVFVAGAAFFGQPDYPAVIQKMKTACQPPQPR